MSAVELKIRANQLEVGDLFIKQGGKYRVIKIVDGKIYYDHSRGCEPPYIGAKSMEFIMWVGKWEPAKRPPPKPKKYNPNPKRPMIPVKAFTKDGKEIGIFNSIRRAAIELGIDYKYIERYVKKELVKEKHPYHFEKIKKVS